MWVNYHTLYPCDSRLSHGDVTILISSKNCCIKQIMNGFIRGIVKIFHLSKDWTCSIQLGFASLNRTFNISTHDFLLLSYSYPFIICILFMIFFTLHRKSNDKVDPFLTHPTLWSPPVIPRSSQKHPVAFQGDNLRKGTTIILITMDGYIQWFWALFIDSTKHQFGNNYDHIHCNKHELYQIMRFSNLQSRLVTWQWILALTTIMQFSNL